VPKSGLAGQVLYHLSHASSSLCFGYFIFQIGWGITIFAWISLEIMILLPKPLTYLGLQTHITTLSSTNKTGSFK
jgi:hypothetical protein